MDENKLFQQKKIKQHGNVPEIEQNRMEDRVRFPLSSWPCWKFTANKWEQSVI